MEVVVCRQALWVEEACKQALWVVEACKQAWLAEAACMLAWLAEEVCKLASEAEELACCKMASPGNSAWLAACTGRAWGCGPRGWVGSCQTGRSGPAARGGGGAHT